MTSLLCLGAFFAAIPAIQDITTSIADQVSGLLAKHDVYDYRIGEFLCADDQSSGIGFFAEQIASMVAASQVEYDARSETVVDLSYGLDSAGGLRVTAALGVEGQRVATGSWAIRLPQTEEPYVLMGLTADFQGMTGLPEFTPSSVPLSGRPFIKDNTARSKASSKQGVQVLRRSSSKGYVPRPLHPDRREIYTAMTTDDVFALRLTNESTKEVAAKVLIDGRSLFHHSADDGEVQPPTHYLLEPNGAALIEGWYVSPTQRRSFTVENVARELGRTKTLGVITVVFFDARKAVGGQRPNPVVGVRHLTQRTGLGESLTSDSTPLETRYVGTASSIVSIRYANSD